MKTISPKKNGCCGPTKIASRNRYDSRTGADLSSEEIIFGAAVRDYMTRYRQINPTCGEILDVAMTLGYSNGERDFEAAVQTFTKAVAAFKRRKRRPHPLWSEVLGILRDLGYTRSDSLCVDQ